MATGCTDGPLQGCPALPVLLSVDPPSGVVLATGGDVDSDPELCWMLIQRKGSINRTQPLVCTCRRQRPPPEVCSPVAKLKEIQDFTSSLRQAVVRRWHSNQTAKFQQLQGHLLPRPCRMLHGGSGPPSSTTWPRTNAPSCSQTCPRTNLFRDLQPRFVPTCDRKHGVGSTQTFARGG